MRCVIFIAVLCFIMGCTTRQPEAGQKTHVDILEYVAKHPYKVSIIHYPDGSTYKPKYGDIKLEEAEKLLDGKYERPWTVSKVIKWYSEAEKPKIRVALLRLLAASRDERAISVLGSALDDSALDVRIGATYGILDYFIETAVAGSTERHMMAVHEWWQEQKSKYRKQ